MKVFTLSICLAVALSCSSARAGLVISEVVYNEPGSDTAGEWIELFNNGPAAIDLSDYKIGDEETMNPPSAENGGMWKFPAGATIPAGGVQIVAVSGALFTTNYGFAPTYEVVETSAAIPNLSNYTAWASNPSPVINMSNSNDQAVLLDGSDQIVDAVSWGNTFAFNPGLADAEADGQSYERVNGYVDTNTAADWRLGNPSSPGSVAVPEASTATLLLGLLVVASIRRRAQG
ncbi:MAG: lamin tail domain-containing protein [Pirellulales bacterium]